MEHNPKACPFCQHSNNEKYPLYPAEKQLQDMYTEQLRDTSEFYKNNPREDARPDTSEDPWDDLTDAEKYEEDYDRYRDENLEPDPDDQRDNRIFDGDNL